MNAESGDLTIEGARLEAEALVESAVREVLPGRESRQDGRGDGPCDPPGSGLIDYDFVLAVSVPAAEVDQAAVDVWAFFKAKGVERTSAKEPAVGAKVAPAPRGELDGFTVAVTGNREDEVVYVGVATPCLPPEGLEP